MRLIVKLKYLNELLSPEELVRINYSSKEDFLAYLEILATDAFEDKRLSFIWLDRRWHTASFFSYYSDYEFQPPEVLTLDEWFPERTILKKICPNKVEGSCPLHNLHCNFPECEK